MNIYLARKLLIRSEEGTHHNNHWRSHGLFCCCPAGIELDIDSEVEQDAEMSVKDWLLSLVARGLGVRKSPVEEECKPQSGSKCICVFSIYITITTDPAFKHKGHFFTRWFFSRVPQKAHFGDNGALDPREWDGGPWTGQSCLLIAPPPVSGALGSNGRTAQQNLHNQPGLGGGHHDSPLLPRPNPLSPQRPHGERRGEDDDQETRVGGGLRDMVDIV